MDKLYRKFVISTLYCFCIGFGIGLVDCDPMWETVRVKWGIPITGPNVFVPMPLTETEAIDQDFQNINSNCQSGKFLGYRYWKKGDSLILIYDVTGYIAGIQTAIPVDLMSKVKTSIRTVGSSAYQQDTLGGKQYFIQTAYFIEPSQICGSGREAQEFQSEVGTNLYFQNGSRPLTDSVLMPKFQSEVSYTGWTKGGCFPTMGQHYWLDITEDKDCQYFHPAFLLYNHGKLSGFGFANPGNFTFSDRFEYPSIPVLQNFIQPYPTCLTKEFQNSGGFSSTHVYFNARPENLQC